MYRCETKNDAKWLMFAVLIANTMAFFWYKNPIVGFTLLAIFIVSVTKEIFFPIQLWNEKLPNFKRYCITGMSIVALSSFIAAYFDKVDDYNEIILFFVVIWGGYMDYKIYRRVG